MVCDVDRNKNMGGALSKWECGNQKIVGPIFSGSTTTMVSSSELESSINFIVVPYRQHWRSRNVNCLGLLFYGFLNSSNECFTRTVMDSHSDWHFKIMRRIYLWGLWNAYSISQDGLINSKQSVHDKFQRAIILASTLSFLHHWYPQMQLVSKIGNDH